MAQLKYVDWDGLVYYDGKVKQYIDDKMTACLKMGGHIVFAELPAPSYNNLNYIYKITDEFTSSEHFVSPGYQFNANTWVQVVDINGVYKYNIFDEADQTTSEILAELDALDERVTTVETDVAALEASLTGAHTAITELSSSIEKLGQDAEQDRADVVELDDRIDELQQTVLAVFNDNVATTKQVAENTASIGSIESDVRELKIVASDINAALEAVTEQSNDNKNQIDNLVGIATTQAERVTLTENRITAVEEKTASIDTTVVEHASAIESLNDDVLAAANTAAAAQAKAVANEVSIVDVRNEVAENTDAIAANAASIEEYQASTDEKFADIDADIELLSSNIGEAQADIDSVEAALTEHKVDTTGKLSALETRVERNEKDIALLTTNIDTKADVADLEGLATEEFVVTAINGIEVPSLDGYATESYVDEAVKNVKVDTTDLATKDEVAAVEAKIPSVEGLATETYVTNAIAQAQLGGDKEVDLSGYATKDDLNTLATKAELENYSTTEQMNSAIESAVDNIDIPEVPTTLSAFDNDTNFITIAEVEAKNYLTEHQDISSKLDVTAYEADKATFALKSDLDNLATTDFVETELTQALADKAAVNHSHLVEDIKDFDLSGYATKDDIKDFVTLSEVEAQGYLKEHQDISHLATKDELATVQNQSANNEVKILALDGELLGLKSTVEGIVVPTKVSELENDSDYATETFVQESIEAIDIPQAEIYKVDFNSPDYSSAIEAYNAGKVLVLINAAPDATSYALMNYANERYITFTKFLMSRSEAYGAFNTYYLAPDNTWEVSQEVILNKVEANVGDATTAQLTSIRVGKNVYSIPVLDGYATQEFVLQKIAEAEISGGDIDLSAYYTKSETDTAISDAINALNVPTATSQLTNDSGFITASDIPSLDGCATETWVNEQGFAKASDIPTDYLTAIPEEYVTETELEGKGYLTTHQDLSEYAKLTDIPTVPTNVSEFNNDAGYLTEHQDISGKADVDHTHVLADIEDYTAPDLSEYAKEADVASALDTKQDKLVSGTNIATINGQSLLSGGNIEVAGGTVSSPDDIYLTFADPTTVAVGGIAVGTTITNWSLTKLIQTMLFGDTSSDEPVYETIADQIIAETPVTYVLDETGALVESQFAQKTMNAEEAALESEESYFYQITDENGTVIESGFQQNTPYQEEDFLTVAIPDYVTAFHVEQYNDDISDWQEVNWKLVAKDTSEQTIEGYTIYRVPEEYEVLSGITIRLVIEE